jgi:hypothetical protein
MKTPVYNGYPLSLLVRLSLPESPVQFWQWGQTLHECWDEGSETINMLATMGYERVASAESKELYTYLMSQLCDVQHVNAAGLEEEKQNLQQLWAYTGDIEHVKQVPVILAFRLPEGLSPPLEQSIPMLSFLPPPQLGELALIKVDGKDYVYKIEELGESGAATWRALSDALRALAGQSEWVAFTPLIQACSDLSTYQTMVHETTVLIRSTKGKEQKEAKARLDAIKTAGQHFTTLQESLRHPDWVVHWGNIQRMAKELASSYYALHQSRSALELIQPTLLSEEILSTTLTPLTERRKKRATKPRVPPPHPVVAKDPPVVHTRADIFTHYMQRGLLDVTKFIHYPDVGIAELRQAFSKEKGEMLITIKPGTDEGWATIGEALQTLEKRLGDEVSDTFLALLALAIETNGVENVNVPFYINPDDILAMCQREKSNGSYTPPQRLAVIEHLRTLTWAHVRATREVKRGKRTLEQRIEGAFVDVLSGKIGEYNTITGEQLWEKREVRIGNWAKMVPELSRQTAIMLRQILKYHAHNQQHEKRLGTYLTWQFRVNARHGGVVRCEMETLLQQSGITPDLKNPQRTRKRIEDALKQLKEDEVIGEYNRIIEDTLEAKLKEQRIQTVAYRWWQDYVHQLWVIHPPQSVKQAYQALLQESNER